MRNGTDFQPPNPDDQDFLDHTPEPRGRANVHRMPDLPYEWHGTTSDLEGPAELTRGRWECRGGVRVWVPAA